MNVLGQLVARLREERNLTQAMLAARADVDVETIGRFEQGRGPGWSRKTARSVFRALSDSAPIEKRDADRYFELSKFKPDDDAVQQAIAAGSIVTGPKLLKAMSVPDDLRDLVSKMIFSFGEARVRALLRAALAFAIEEEPAVAGGAVSAVAIELSDPETGARLRKYIPAQPTPPPPAATSRRNKTG